MGGGLGGGSSDAATTLLALNRLWDLNWSREKLMELGLNLGADVPVFIFGENAFAEGVGEKLKPIKLLPAWYLVLTPPVHVSTADIFASKELTRNTIPVRIPPFSVGLRFFRCAKFRKRNPPCALRRTPAATAEPEPTEDGAAYRVASPSAAGCHAAGRPSPARRAAP